MKQKTKSMIVSLIVWSIIHAFLFVISPLSYYEKELGNFMLMVTGIVVPVLLILFLVWRMVQGMNGNWHPAGTVLFHCMNLPAIVGAMLTYFSIERLPIQPIILNPYAFLENEYVNVTILVVSIFAILLFLALIAIDLIVFALKKIIGQKTKSKKIA